MTNYEPKSPQEQALKSTLLDFQDGVNTLDAKKIERLIHPKASLMTGRERKILSKKAYVKILPERSDFLKSVVEICSLGFYSLS